MSCQITLEIADDSDLGLLIDNMAAREQLSREEAALKLSWSKNGAVHRSQNGAKSISRQAAVEEFIGCLKDENPHQDDLWRHHFNAEYYAEIERENQRDLVWRFLISPSVSIAAPP